MRQLEEIQYIEAVDYSKPLSRDFQSFHYKPLEACEDWSWGVLLHIHYKTPYIYATRFEGTIKPHILEKSAIKAYKTKLKEILEEMEIQRPETITSKPKQEDLEDSPFR